VPKRGNHHKECTPPQGIKQQQLAAHTLTRAYKSCLAFVVNAPRAKISRSPRLYCTVTALTAHMHCRFRGLMDLSGGQAALPGCACTYEDIQRTIQSQVQTTSLCHQLQLPLQQAYGNWDHIVEKHACNMCARQAYLYASSISPCSCTTATPKNRGLR